MNIIHACMLWLSQEFLNGGHIKNFIFHIKILTSKKCRILRNVKALSLSCILLNIIISYITPSPEPTHRFCANPTIGFSSRQSTSSGGRPGCWAHLRGYANACTVCMLHACVAGSKMAFDSTSRAQLWCTVREMLMTS